MVVTADLEACGSTEVVRYLEFSSDVEQDVGLTFDNSVLITGCYRAIIEVVPVTYNQITSNIEVLQLFILTICYEHSSFLV